MKYRNSSIKILLGLLLMSFNKLSAHTDSLYLRIDSCQISVNYNINGTCQEIKEENVDKKVKYVKPLTNKIKKLYKKPKSFQPEGFSDWLDEAWEFIKNLGKPVHGYYEEDGQRNEGPYFMFNRMENNNFKNK